ncbi:hypothetical protein L6164_021286 [Bauhinia variegata]|uniref:Uncharacterized protein n=1 Tax=Bauhinia variegata TaxID=167791 RepID=A0ACB9MZ72_BAUVA|nr:hypothetical protein L6164_021286 [Bauhinia variegata]
MGNCGFKGFNHGAADEKMVKVVTSNGGIMELWPPVTVECITNGFAGHGIFRSRRDMFSEPMLHNEELNAGEVYYLLPLNPSKLAYSKSMARERELGSNLTPYRMSSYEKNNNNNNNSKMWSEPQAEVLPRYNSSGVWKVKLVISPEQLSEILSQESRTEALIESVRTVAKCGNGVPSSVANSDQWSMASSWKGSMSDKVALDSFG